MTDVIEIGKEQAIALLDRAVAEKGAEFVYEPVSRGIGSTCSYESNGAPSCIVGHALVYVGVPVENLVKLDNADQLDTWEKAGADITFTPNATGVHELADSGALEVFANVRLTAEAEAIFKEAQRRQDYGHPWGESVAVATTGYR